MSKIAEDMLRKLPRDYVPHEVKEALVRLGGMLPMNIFLRQEIDRMQKILTLVRRTLTDLKMALEGTIIMSDDLKETLDNMYDARYEYFKPNQVLSRFIIFLKRNRSFFKYINNSPQDPILATCSCRPLNSVRLSCQLVKYQM